MEGDLRQGVSAMPADQPTLTPPTRDSQVTLREIDAGTVREICRLAVRPDQLQFVAPNAVSLAQALFAPHVWFRAIYAGDTAVGFVQLDLDAEKPEYSLWRFMIDARYQKLGFGRAAMQLVIGRVRDLPGATELVTSVVPGEGSPLAFYEGLGFALTGEEDGGELVLKLPL